jgi:hypothetical protein
MLRDDAAVTIPPSCMPRWRDLAVLAWVAARAFGPQRAPMSLVWIIACCSWLVYLPSVASLHARSQLAVCGRSALVGVERVRHPRGFGWVCGALLLMIGVVLIVLWIDVGTAVFLSSVAFAAPVLLAFMVLRPWQIVRAQSALRRVHDDLRARDPDAAVYQLGGLAAWPQWHRHGSTLVQALLKSPPIDGFVVAYPRTKELVRWYVKMGMLEHPSGAVYFDMRAHR